MSKLRMKAIREMNEKDLKGRVIEMRTDLSKLEDISMMEEDKVLFFVS